jgi:hypothetical protein
MTKPVDQNGGSLPAGSIVASPGIPEQDADRARSREESTMRTSILLGLTITAAAMLGCRDSQGPLEGPTPAVALQDVVVTSLPAPYYHFEYRPGGPISRVSFASDFLSYDVVYRNGRIAELRNNAVGNTDRLQYVYDAFGRVATVNYLDPMGTIYARVRLTYDGDRLSRLDRERNLAAGFTLEKTMSFSYYADGNLEEIVDHRPAQGGQPASTTVDRFEQYDDKVNVDAFDLIHNDFFDHIVLLPDVQLQRGNPARETFTGGGEDYRFDFTYTYDAHDRPLLKTGTATILTGPDAGRIIPLRTAFSYY